MNGILNKQAEQKHAIRQEALQRRDAIPLPVRRVKDRAIRALLLELEEFSAAGKILFYASFRTEVQTGPIIEEALIQDKKVLMPKVNEQERRLSKHVITSLEDLTDGYQGIPEPNNEHTMKVEEIDLIIVPGVAFDTEGWRIGYGGGYYDKLLPRVKGTRPIVALAYEEQLFDEIPYEEHDVGVDIIITDRRILRIPWIKTR